jgi:glycoside/pentoside/hexuronide:cation symporter, GPH family
LVGVIQDATRTRFGRRKTWIAASVPLLCVSVWFVFNPPENASLSYLYVALFVMYVGFTMAQVGHFSWGAEIATDYHERSRVHGWRETCAVLGMLTVLVVPAVVQQLKLGGPGDDVRAMGWYVIILFPLLALVTLSQVPEPPPPPLQKLDWRAALSAVWANRPMRLALVAEFLSGFAPGVTGALFVFFFQSVLELGGTANVLLLVYFVAAVIGVPLWIQLSYRLGKHRTLAAAVLVQAVTLSAIVLLPKGEVGPAVLGMALAGVAANAAPFLLRSMVADVVDQDRLDTGEQRTGLYFGLMLLAAKAALALAPGITYVTLDWAGFDQALGPKNSPQALSTLTWLFIAAPILANLALALLVWRFPLDARRQAELRAAIEAGATKGS